MNVSFVKHWVPVPVKNALYAVMDLKNRNDPMIPPLKLRRIIGQKDTYTKDRTCEIRRYVLRNSTDTVLDVGCGCGSLPYSLVHYADFEGNYEGLDIVRPVISWLNQNVAVAYPNFHFTHADIFNGSYNEHGQIRARDYRFPFPTGVFDCAFTSSVFTHMLPEDLENYLAEISRVLKPMGRCFISWFILPQQKFTDTEKGYWILDPKCPEQAVAYPLDYIQTLYERNGFVLTKILKYGPQTGHVVSR